MYEHRRQKPIPHAAFVRRLISHAAWAAALGVGSLLAGMAGYVRFERMSWLDGFLNAAMLLGGMGPVATPSTPEGKLFAGIYALYSGVVFLVVAGIVLAPAVHRLLHRFHFDDK